MTIFSTNKQDNKVGFYRIIQPLRFLQRGGWTARTIPFRGNNTISEMPIHNELLMRLSEGADFILTNPIYDQKEFLKILDLRKARNCKLIVDVFENYYINPDLRDYLPIIDRNIVAADGVIVPTEELKILYQGLNENIFVLPSSLDFGTWDSLPRKNQRKFKIGYTGTKQDLEKVEPTLKELLKDHKIEFVNITTKNIVDFPEELAKKNITVAVFPVEDTGVNHYKSNIELIEVMALGIPIVVSPIEPYRGLPILYANSNFEWYECLEKLIKDKKFRKEMGLSEYLFVKNEYDMTKYVSKLQEWLKNLPRKEY